MPISLQKRLLLPIASVDSFLTLSQPAINSTCRMGTFGGASSAMEVDDRRDHANAAEAARCSRLAAAVWVLAAMFASDE